MTLETYIVLSHRISYGTVAQASTCMEEVLEWFNYLCASFMLNPNPQVLAYTINFMFLDFCATCKSMAKA